LSCLLCFKHHEDRFAIRDTGLHPAVPRSKTPDRMAMCERDAFCTSGREARVKARTAISTKLATIRFPHRAQA
jgi:hypothetical protein